MAFCLRRWCHHSFQAEADGHVRDAYKEPCRQESELQQRFSAEIPVAMLLNETLELAQLLGPVGPGDLREPVPRHQPQQVDRPGRCEWELAIQP